MGLMYLPTEISNPATGERIVFDEDASTDERLVWDEWRPANHEPPPTHVHPATEERFVVREGTLVVQLNGVDNRLDDGEDITVPPQTPHRSYTEDDPARFRREVAPPGQWREFLTDRFAYYHTGENVSVIGELLQTALWLRVYPDVVVPQRPPRAVQRLLFPVLATVARATGRTAHHPYPRDSG